MCVSAHFAGLNYAFRRDDSRRRPRTPKYSQSAATLRAGLKPPICEMWMRMKSIARFRFGAVRIV
jgi:hypothetical protein